MRNSDPFASFETSEGETAWESEQTNEAVKWLHGRPHFADLVHRVHEYRRAPPSLEIHIRGDSTISLEPAKSTGGVTIVRRKGKEAPAVLLALEGGDAAHRKHVDFMEPSPSGRLVAVGMSEGGAENETVHVLDTRTGKDVGDRSYNVQLGVNGHIAWLPDDSGYIYMRERDPKEVALEDRHRDASLAFHRIGTPAEHDIEFVGARAAGTRIVGDYDFPYPHLSPDGHDVVVAVAHGINPDFTVYTKKRADAFASKAEWTRLYEERDGVNAVAVDNGRALASRFVDGRYVVEETALRGPPSRRVLYTSKLPIAALAMAGKDLYIVETEIATRRLVVLHDGAASPIAMPEGTSIRFQSLRVDPLTHELILKLTSWTEPDTWWTVARGKRAMEPFGEASRPFKTDAYEVLSLDAPSRDGQQIPITIVRSKNRANNAPRFVWAHAYGCYGIVLGPYFTPSHRAFLDEGGTLVFAHVRGGGEKGVSWHQQARGPTKIKTVEDLIDSLKFLRSEGYGKDGGLFVSGLSAGGIPVGGVVAREPELIDGVAIDVGVLNVTRMEAGSATGVLHKQEYGTTDTPEGARTLRDIDAYENIRDGRKYPPVLIRAGLNDSRVPRWQSSKFAARLQQATIGTSPILLRLTGGGHIASGSADEDDAADAELLAFVFATVNHPLGR